jgi:hypothetical protein
MLMQTDQVACYDARGQIKDCGSGSQDGEQHAGTAWPRPRFIARDGIVIDRLTGLQWCRNANWADYPMMWDEAFDCVLRCNQENLQGCNDWRLPNRRELFSLISHARINPSLPDGHPFRSVFAGYYWTASSCRRLPHHAWTVHLGGGRVAKGMKSSSYLVWPVRSESGRAICPLLQTGQHACFDSDGAPRDCTGSFQDGDVRAGIVWPEDRMAAQGEDIVLDRATGLMWHRNADLANGRVDWQSAMNAVAALNQNVMGGYSNWRLPNIIELESICHLDRHDPAIVGGTLFDPLGIGYWSATTSVYEPSYAWVL